MTLYSAALFLHIVGALLLFATLTLEGIALRQARRATTVVQVRDSAGIAGLTRFAGPASAAGILVPGLFMAATAWGPVPWILVGLGTWVLVGVLGAVNGVRLASVGRAAAESARMSSGLAARIGDPLLLASWRVRVALVLGVVLLMPVKPSPMAALLVVAAAAAAGVVAGLPAWRRAGPRVALDRP